MPASGPRVHVLHPGDVAIADRGERLETLLGSCVSIILTDPRRTVASMCHIVHSGPRGDTAKGGAHAEGARERMYALLLARGITPRLCDAFVYGGGNMFPALVRNGHVGDGNASRALEMLQDDGVRIVHQDLGGTAYRKLAWTVGPEWPSVTAVAV
jgi:chemotaxis protein CheD